MNKQLEILQKVRQGTNDLAIERLINSLGTPIKDLGISEEDYNNEEYFSTFDADEEYEKFARVPQFPGRREDRAVEEKTYYRYTGALQANSRDFCRRLVTRTNDRIFTREDIAKLNTANPGFGKNGATAYNVFRFRGGGRPANGKAVSCKHVWTRYVMKNGVLQRSKIQPKQP